MTVGKPDFNLNSFGIQYKEKKVKYTEDLMKDAQDGKGTGKPWNGNLDYGSPQTSATERSETNVSNYIDDYKGEEEPDGTTFEKLDEVGSHDDDKWHKSTTPKDRAAWVKNMTGKQPLKGAKFTPKIAKNSAETIFKAISLKLDLMNKFGKEAGAKRVTPEEMPQKEAQHTLQGGRDANGQHTVKPKGVGTSVRRVNPKTHLMEKVPNEVKIEGKGNERASTQGDVVNARAASPATVTNAQQMITDNPTTSSGEGTIDPAIASGNSGTVSTWNDGLPATGNSATGGNTTETASAEASAEDIENAANNQTGTDFKNSKMGKDQAARRAKRHAKILAAGGKINLATSEINAMTDGMKELFKGFNGSDAGEEADGKTGFTGKVHEKDGTVSDWQNGQHTVRGHGVGKPKKELKPREVKTSASEINAMTDDMKELMKDDKDDKDFAIRERNYEALSTGGGKPDKSLLLDVDKPAVKKIKSDAEETLFKAISLKLDLMKRDGEKIGTEEKDTRQMTDRFNEEYNLPDTVAGKKTKRMLDDHVSPVDN